MKISVVYYLPPIRELDEIQMLNELSNHTRSSNYDPENSRSLSKSVNSGLFARLFHGNQYKIKAM